LEHDSGLRGLSANAAATGDIRSLVEMQATGSAVAASAVNVYLHRLRAKIAAMVAAMDGVDGLVFTGGVGEHSHIVRRDACRRLRWMGIQIDETANAQATDEDTDLTAAGAAVRTLVIHAREDLVIARASRRLLDGRV
jgi:acetate kinase